MSFHIVKAGKREEVREQVREANVYGDLAGEATKRFVDELLSMSGSDVVIVKATGHAGTVPNQGHINVTVSVDPAL